MDASGILGAAYDGARVDKDASDPGIGQRIVDIFTYGAVSWIDNVTQPVVQPTNIYTADPAQGTVYKAGTAAPTTVVQQIPPALLLVGGAVFLFLLLRK